MVKHKKYRKKEKKRVFRYEDYFEPYDILEVWRIPNQEVPKHVLYRWAKSRVRRFKKAQKRKKNMYPEIFEKPLSFKNDGLFLTYFRFHILLFIYIFIPLCFVLVMFNWFVFSKPLQAIEYVKYWNTLFADYAITYREFVLFFHYYFSPMVITLKIFIFPPIFFSHLFIIWYVHIYTKWNDYMERKLISIAVWRLGIGYIPASAEIINSWVFWGERFYIDFYWNTLITAPFFAIKQIWKFFGTILNVSFKTIIIFMFNVFK
jgi:hypothetical protein